MAGVDQVALDDQVLVDEVGSVSVVGMDAADLGRCDENVIRLFLGHELVHRLLAGQVELLARAGDDPGVASLFKPADDGRAHHAAVTGDEDLGVEVHGT